MKHREKLAKPTTVSVNQSARDYINEEADKLGLSQRQMIQRLVETYENLKNSKAGATSLSPEEQISSIYECLEKVLKRDDRVVAFIKEQEKVLLNPILRGVQSTDAQLNQLVEILSNLE